MSNDVVIHLTECKKNSSVASARIATFISKTLNLPLKDSGTGKAEKYDRIFLVNGPTAFFSWRDELADMVSKCKDLVYVQNDYTLYMPSQVKHVARMKGWKNEKNHAVPPVRWTTIPARMTNERDRYINWNCLTFDKSKYIPPHERKIASRVFYYGSFRNGRKSIFYNYFRPNLYGIKSQEYPILVSCSSKSASKFKDINSSIETIPPFTDFSEVRDYGLTIYMEDNFSNDNYSSPANRFYECVSYGIPMVFDENSLGTMVEGGFPEAEQWAVLTSDDVMKFLRRRNKIAEKQHELWHRNYIPALKRELKKLYKELSG